MPKLIPDSKFFVDVVDDDLLCPICFNILHNAVSCKGGHSFCENCIILCLEQKQQCPMDRKKLYAVSLCNNRTVYNMVNKLLVRCQFY